jgi:hypothetical protein
MSSMTLALDERVLRNHYNLSRACGDLTRVLFERADASRLPLRKDAPEVPRLLTEFRYEVSPWPLLISAETRERFARIIREVPPLLRRATLRFYENDLPAFSASYKVPEATYELLARMPEEMEKMLVRYDLVLVEDRPQILEINVGSKIGGWQIGWYWQQLAERIASDAELQGWTVSHTSTAEAFCAFMHRSVYEHVGSESTGTIVAVVEQNFLDRRFHEELSALHDRVVASSPLPGQMVFAVNTGTIETDARGRIRYDGRVVDGYVAAMGQPPDQVSEAHIRKTIFTPDNTLHRIFSDKLNFAMLHAAKTAGMLDEADARLVDHYIPWAASFGVEAVEYEGRMTSVRELALARKHEMVVKRGMSRQGKHVVVGRFVSDDEWSRAVDRAVEKKHWLLQHYCPPDQLYVPNEQGAAEHNVVWGIFGCGPSFGGAFTRMMDPSIGEGVINAARGAKEAVVLEV